MNEIYRRHQLGLGPKRPNNNRYNYGKVIRERLREAALIITTCWAITATIFAALLIWALF